MLLLWLEVESHFAEGFTPAKAVISISLKAEFDYDLINRVD